MAYLAVIIPLSVLALVLPNFTRSTPGPTLSTAQAFFFALFTTALYGVFLAIQTVRHRAFFIERPRGESVAVAAHGSGHGGASLADVVRDAALLVVTMLPSCCWRNRSQSSSTAVWPSSELPRRSAECSSR